MRCCHGDDGVAGAAFASLRDGRQTGFAEFAPAAETARDAVEPPSVGGLRVVGPLGVCVEPELFAVESFVVVL